VCEDYKIQLSKCFTSVPSISRGSQEPISGEMVSSNEKVIQEESSKEKTVQEDDSQTNVPQKKVTNDFRHQAEWMVNLEAEFENIVIGGWRG
jgi:hypothetical protein